MISKWINYLVLFLVLYVIYWLYTRSALFHVLLNPIIKPIEIMFLTFFKWLSAPFGWMFP